VLAAFAAAVTLCIPASGTERAGAPESSPRDDAYRQAVLRVKAQYHAPGVVAGVWIPGKKPWKIAEGYGDVASATPIHLDDYFPICSVTKSYTVTLILQLARAKALSLDDPIGKFVDGVPRFGGVTLAQLAAMESGVKSYTDIPYFIQELTLHPERQWTPREIVDLAHPLSPVFDPGAEYNYSNTNTVLLGMVVEKVTGRALADIYREWLFQPLGLRKTSYPNSAEVPVPHPTPYLVDPETGQATEWVVVNLSAMGASGGMVTTLDELHRWGKALGTGHFIGARLQKLRMEHSRPATDGPEYDRYGLGMGELKGWWGHTGQGVGFQACTFYDPRTGATIAVILNSSQPAHAAVEVFKALADVVHPPGAQAEPLP